MSDINTVSLLNQLQSLAAKASGQSVEFAGDGVQFGDVFQKTLGSVNQFQQQSDALKARYELGDNSVGIGEVMVAAQKSNLAFEATLQVRNKLVQAYKEIMDMPV